MVLGEWTWTTVKWEGQNQGLEEEIEDDDDFNTGLATELENQTPG